MLKQDSNCVTTCYSGFFSNYINFICQPCPSSCLTCTSSSTCTTCYIGLTLINGICVGPSCSTSAMYSYHGNCLTSCPTGTFNSNYFCIRICSANLYYWNNSCYDSCPTSLHTPEACVTVCPSGFRQNGDLCLMSPSSICQLGQFLNPLTQNC